MESIVELIRKRISCRTYEVKIVEEEKVKQLSDFLSTNTRCPFGSTLRFQLLNLTEMERKEMKTLGTYGVIKGARLFIVGTVTRGDKAMEDYGYCMEKNILIATHLGLGTCWLGGTFNRSGFARRMNMSENELLPAVSPIGYVKGKRSMTDNLFRFMASSSKRKPWNELFYDGSFKIPLGEEHAEKYAVPLESVRLGPSASNRQPWRVCKEKDKNVFHFYLERTKGYKKFFEDIQLQNIDMGIAMCHFELSAKEIGLEGNWNEHKPDIQVDQMEYIVSWVER